MTALLLQAEDARRSWMHRAAGDHVGRFQSFMRGRVQQHVAGNPTGVSVTWLGTSSGAPTRTRNNSGIALRATDGGRDDIMIVDVGACFARCVACAVCCVCMARGEPVGDSMPLGRQPETSSTVFCRTRTHD